MNRYKLNDKVICDEKETTIVKVFNMGEIFYYKTEDSLKDNPYLYIHEDNILPMIELTELSKESLLEFINRYDAHITKCKICEIQPKSVKEFLITNFTKISEIDYLLDLDFCEDIKISKNIILYDDMLPEETDSEASSYRSC